jgi:hypothetical protein
MKTLDLGKQTFVIDIGATLLAITILGHRQALYG